MGSVIQAVGTYSPERVLSNQDLERILALSDQETSDQWIVQRTGIRFRRVASSGENVATMALGASLDAIRQVQDIIPIQHVIVATNTPYQKFPNVAGYVTNGLIDADASFVDKNASGVDLAAGCGGVNFALMHADHSISSGQFDSVLVLGAEHLTRVTNYADRGTCVLFGDGASAYLLRKGDSSERGFLGHLPKGDGSGRDLIYCANDEEKVTLLDALEALDKSKEPKLSRGDVLHMDGKRVFRYVTELWGSLIDGFYDSKLNPEGIPFDRVEAIAPHLANLRCLESVAGLKDSKGNLKAPGFLEKCGLVGEGLNDFCNTSTASQGARVKRFLQEAKEGELLLMHGYGAGLQSCANLYGKPSA